MAKLADALEVVAIELAEIGWVKVPKQRNQVQGVSPPEPVGTRVENANVLNRSVSLDARGKVNFSRSAVHEFTCGIGRHQ